MNPRALHDLEADVHAETAACISRVQSLIDRARENGARIDTMADRDFACAVLDAAQDVARAFRRAAEEMQEDLDDEALPRRMAVQRRDYLAYRS